MFAIYYLHKVLGFSPTLLSRLFQRSYTTIFTSNDKFEKKMLTYKISLERITRLTALINTQITEYHENDPR